MNTVEVSTATRVENYITESSKHLFKYSYRDDFATPCREFFLKTIKANILGGPAIIIIDSSYTKVEVIGTTSMKSRKDFGMFEDLVFKQYKKHESIKKGYKSDSHEIEINRLNGKYNSLLRDFNKRVDVVCEKMKLSENKSFSSVVELETFLNT